MIDVFLVLLVVLVHRFSVGASSCVFSHVFIILFGCV